MMRKRFVQLIVQTMLNMSVLAKHEVNIQRFARTSQWSGKMLLKTKFWGSSSVFRIFILKFRRRMNFLFFLSFGSTRIQSISNVLVELALTPRSICGTECWSCTKLPQWISLETFSVGTYAGNRKAIYFVPHSPWKLKMYEKHTFIYVLLISDVTIFSIFSGCTVNAT